MAEQQKATDVAKGESRVSDGESKAPRTVGRQQAGEALEGPLTTRVPRGVGEPPADAKAEHDGVRLTQDTVAKTVEAETDRGFRGESLGSDYNEAYTLKGVTSGMPTPETTVHTPRARQ